MLFFLMQEAATDACPTGAPVLIKWIGGSATNHPLIYLSIGDCRSRDTPLTADQAPQQHIDGELEIRSSEQCAAAATPAWLRAKYEAAVYIIRRAPEPTHCT
jgi:hypothetical protein